MVEVRNGKCWRIFKNAGAAALSKATEIKEYPRKNAKEEIRRQVFELSGGECQNCGNPLTWGSMHMHEKIHRGKGGEVSVENCEALCYGCHIEIKHGDRRLRWSPGERINCS